MMLLNLLLIGLAVTNGARAASALTGHSKQLFDESMEFLDKIYDPDAGYLFDYFSQAALAHTTRSSPWYAAGLLQRNTGDDVEQATKIITNVIGGQYNDPSDQWYGDYTKYPETPIVGTSAYPQTIYDTWDPNWRGFVGVTFVIIYEEFGDLLSDDLKSLMLESLKNATVGDTYRVGGVDGDNLYPAYSNPWLMRCVVAGWTGRRWNDTNMTATAETDAKAAIDLFNINNTLSEFNSPTYISTALTALTMWAKYLPQDSIMKQNGARMVQQVWLTIAEMYHPLLRNVAGPMDRAYGFDMNKYVSIIGLNIWTLVGKDKAPGFKTPWIMTHTTDYQSAPLIAILAPYQNSLIPKETIAKFSKFSGAHTYTAQAYAPPADLAVRNITTWVGSNMTIGAQSFNQTVLGGFSESPANWNPAVIQWPLSDSSMGFFTLHGTELSLHAEVAPGFLNLTYLEGTSKSVFTFLLSPPPLDMRRDIRSLSDIPGLKISVAGTVDTKPTIGYCGLRGGTCDSINNFEVYNVTFTMPATSTALPNIQLTMTTI